MMEAEVDGEAVVALVAMVVALVGDDPLEVYLTQLTALAMTYQALPDDVRDGLDADVVGPAALLMAEGIQAAMDAKLPRQRAH
jgi:hypothetical protein